MRVNTTAAAISLLTPPSWHNTHITPNRKAASKMHKSHKTSFFKLVHMSTYSISDGTVFSGSVTAAVTSYSPAQSFPEGSSVMYLPAQPLV